MKVNNTSNGCIENNNINDIKQTLEQKVIYEIYQTEFINSCELILLENQNDFLDNYFNKITLIIKNKFGEDIFEKETSLYEIKKQCENDFIRDIYWPMRNSCSSTINKFSTNKNEIKNYLTNFIPHCNYNQIPLHICGSKFIQVKNNKELYVICTGCNECYYSSCIKMFCPYCQKDFYSKKITEFDKKEILYPATWEKYHCDKYHINEQMSCINCGNLLWIKNDKLFCKNCRKIYEPKNIIWKCVICDQEFKSGIKIYNPLEYKNIEIAVRDALLYKKIVKPKEVPCNCLTQKEIEYINFYHKENNLCKGLLYYANMDNIDLLVCSLCNTVSLLKNFKWHCPKCNTKFNCQNINYYQCTKRNSYNKNKITPYKLKTSSSTKNTITNNKKILMNKNNSYIKKKAENIHITQENEKSINRNHKNLSLVLDDKNFNFSGIKNGNINCLTTINNINNLDNKFNTTSTIYSSMSNKHIIKALDPSAKSNEPIVTFKSSVLNTQPNNKTCPISPNSKNNYEKIYVNTIYNINKRNTVYKNKIRNNSLNISINLDNNNNSIENKNNKKIIENNSIKYIRQRTKSGLINYSTPIYVPKKNIRRTRCSSCLNTPLYKEIIDVKHNYKKIDFIYNKANVNNLSSDKKVSNLDIEDVYPKKVCRDFSGPKIAPKINKEIFSKYNTQKILINNDLESSTKRYSNNYKNNNLNSNLNNMLITKGGDESLIKEKFIKLHENKNYNNRNPKNKQNIAKMAYNINKRDRLMRENKINNQKKLSEKFEYSNKYLSNRNEEEYKNKKLLSIISGNDRFNKKEKNTQENLKRKLFNYIDSNKNKNANSAKNKIIEYNKNSNGLTNNNINKINKDLDNSTNDELKEFDFEEYKIITQIGQGTFGKIYLVQNKNGEPFSMKKIVLSEELDVKSVINEYKMCYKLKHENIIKILGIYNNKLDKTTYVVYVLMEVGLTDWDKEIRSYKERNIKYNENDLYQIIKQLTSVLSFLQKRNISHRDIKPQNILVFKDKIYKMADFGEAKQMENLNFSLANNSLRGTELYMSPLLFNGLRTGRVDVKHNLYKSDVYSLGLSLLYASTTDTKSLYDIRQFIDMKEVNAYLKKVLGKKYSNKFIDLLRLMLEIHEKNRPDFIELEEIVKKM